MRDIDLDDLLQDERAHRWAVLHGDCPDCASDADMIAALEPVQPFAGSADAENWTGAPPVLTAEGEVATLLAGQFRVEDRAATQAALRELFAGDGPDHLDVVPTTDGPWVRGCLWWSGPPVAGRSYLAFEATSHERFQWLEYRLSRLWPPVFRGMHGSQWLRDDQLDHVPHLGERPEGWGLPPTRQALRRRIEIAEAAWVLAPSALFDGAVPRDLAATIEGRDLVATALADAVRRPAGEVGGVASFNGDRVMALLGGAEK